MITFVLNLSRLTQYVIHLKYQNIINEKVKHEWYQIEKD